METVFLYERHRKIYTWMRQQCADRWVPSRDVRQLLFGQRESAAVINRTAELCGEMHEAGVLERTRVGRGYGWRLTERGMCARVVFMRRQVTDEHRAKLAASMKKHREKLQAAQRAAWAARVAKNRAAPLPPPRVPWEDQMPTVKIVSAADTKRPAVDLSRSSIFALGAACNVT